MVLPLFCIYAICNCSLQFTLYRRPRVDPCEQDLVGSVFCVEQGNADGKEKMQLQCDLAGGVPALAARVLNMQIRCRFETSSVFFVYCGAGNIHQGDTISNHSSLRDSYKSSPTGGT